MSNQNNQNEQNIEQEQNNKKKMVGFKPNLRIAPLLILLCFFVLFVSIVYAKDKNTGFEVLKGTYGQAVVLNENEIFLPCNCADPPLIKTSQIYSIKDKKFYSLNSTMKIPRYCHISAKLDDGRILIFGGDSCDITQEKEIEHVAEIYDPKTNTFKTIGPTISNRYSHVNASYIKLKDGKLFIINGSSMAEIFDPKTEKFYIAGKEEEYYQKSIFDPQGTKKRIKTTLNIYDRKVALALLNDGRVLLVGANYNKEPGNAEIYDPKTNSFTKVGDQVYPRFYRAATTLNDGRVLVTGGTGVYYGYSYNKKETTKPIIGNAEIFDPKTNTFTAINPLNIGRSQHESILLSNGKVLITGGNRGVDMNGVSKDELYDPKSNKFESIPAAKIERYAFHIESLSENKVFINSFNGWEIYKY